MKSVDDIEGKWKITWTDTSNNSNYFYMHITKYGRGFIIDSPVLSLPDCDAGVSSGEINGLSADFTAFISYLGPTATFDFKIPQLGGSGTFSGSILTPDGVKKYSGTCTSEKVS
jgi:hypothetical protein